MNLAPTVGRIVLYKMSEGDNAGDERPAIVTRVITPGAVGSAVNLQVFLDPTRDPKEKGNTMFAESIPQGQGRGEWDWMPFQKDQQARLAPGTPISDKEVPAETPAEAPTQETPAQ